MGLNLAFKGLIYEISCCCVARGAYKIASLAKDHRVGKSGECYLNYDIMVSLPMSTCQMYKNVKVGKEIGLD